MNELTSINCAIAFLRPTALIKVILYGDKKLNDNYPNRPYFEYQKVMLSTS